MPRRECAVVACNSADGSIRVMITSGPLLCSPGRFIELIGHVRTRTSSHHRRQRVRRIDRRLHLSQAGAPSLVIERGRWWTIHDPTRSLTFPTLTHVLAGDGRSSWLSIKTRGNVFAQFLGSARPIELTTGLVEIVLRPYERADISASRSRSGGATAAYGCRSSAIDTLISRSS